MKNIYMLFTGLAIVSVFIVGISMYKDPETSENEVEKVSVEELGRNGNGMGNRNGKQGQPNRGNCLSDDCLLVSDLEYPAGELSQEVQNALVEAINDEYKALSTYNAVIQEFGSIRPFSMIIGAEEQHIASLKSIFNKYGLEIPENTYANNVEVSNTVKEACQVGVEAEIANAKLYMDDLLPAVSEYEDITGVFTNLMNASQQKHLPAFEKCN